MKPVEDIKSLDRVRFKRRRTNKYVGRQRTRRALRNPNHLRAALATDRIVTSIPKEPIAMGLEKELDANPQLRGRNTLMSGQLPIRRQRQRGGNGERAGRGATTRRQQAS